MEVEAQWRVISEWMDVAIKAAEAEGWSVWQGPDTSWRFRREGIYEQFPATPETMDQLKYFLFKMQRVLGVDLQKGMA
ncbi:hypothetical protein [Nocardia sp. NPDC127526]|uniref:hypothetical protein n=1 Tax=Nocardia sp. NPDC127526 TaxID=3345393 RepID=UPI00362E329A